MWRQPRIDGHADPAAGQDEPGLAEPADANRDVGARVAVLAIDQAGVSAGAFW